MDKYINLGDIVNNYTDEQMDLLDEKDIGFAMKTYVKHIRNYKKIYEIIKPYYEAIAEGRFIGYTIKCPNCGVEYKISTEDMNYGKQINCLDCGYYYKQNESIKDFLIISKDYLTK